MRSTASVADNVQEGVEREGLGSTPGLGELFWMAFEESQTPMAITRDDHVILAVNAALGSLTGYEPRTLVGELGDHLVPNNWRKVRARDDEVLHESGMLDAHREVVRRDGSRLRLRIIARREKPAGSWLTLWIAAEDDAGQLPAPPAHREPALTARELQVVGEIARGRRDWEIATALRISPTTVATHVRNATGKLHARSRTHLVSMALVQELIDPNLVFEGEQPWT